MPKLIIPRMEAVLDAGLSFFPNDPGNSDVPENFVWKPKKVWKEWVRTNIELGDKRWRCVSDKAPPERGRAEGNG